MQGGGGGDSQWGEGWSGKRHSKVIKKRGELLQNVEGNTV